jgi:hypothetical protein
MKKMAVNEQEDLAAIVVVFQIEEVNSTRSK